MIWHYFYTFAQTNFLEFPIYYFLLRRKLDWRTTLLIVTFGNAITHPLVFFGFLGSSQSYFTSTLTAEVFAPAIETLVVMYAGRVPAKQAFIAALAANLFSWQIAPIITYLLFF